MKGGLVLCFDVSRKNVDKLTQLVNSKHLFEIELMKQSKKKPRLQNQPTNDLIESIGDASESAQSGISSSDVLQLERVMLEPESLEIVQVESDELTRYLENACRCHFGEPCICAGLYKASKTKTEDALNTVEEGAAGCCGADNRQSNGRASSPSEGTTFNSSESPSNHKSFTSAVGGEKEVASILLDLRDNVQQVSGCCCSGESPQTSESYCGCANTLSSSSSSRCRCGPGCCCS